MATKKVAVKKAVIKNAPVKKAVVVKAANKVAKVNKASTKNVPLRKATAEKKAFVKARTVVKKTLDTLATTTNFNNIISYTEGQQMIDAFVGNMNDLSEVQFNTGMQFDISLFQKLVALPGATKIRIYNAIKAVTGENTTDPFMQHTFVITAVDKDNKIIFLQNSNSNAFASRSADGTSGTEDGVGNMGTVCPAYQ